MLHLNKSRLIGLHSRLLLSNLVKNADNNQHGNQQIINNCFRASSCITGYDNINFHRKLRKQFKSELNAAISIVKRSYPETSSEHRRYLQTTGSNRHGPPFGPKEPNKSNEDQNKRKDDDDNEKKSMLFKAFFWIFTAYLVVSTVIVVLFGNNDIEMYRYVSWNEFVNQMLAKGEVQEIIIKPDMDFVTIVLHEDAIIKGRRTETRRFLLNIVDVPKFEEKLRDAEKQIGVREGVPVVYERSNNGSSRILITLLVLGILVSLLSRGKNMKNPINLDMFSQMGRAKFTLVDPIMGPGKGVKFEDVAGLKEAKVEIMEFVDYLKRPEYYKNLGAKVPKGALLLGPPGCGKTLLAKAVATEAKVPFMQMNGSEFIEMIGGLGAARVRDLFKEAGKRVPCIIYIDEIDAIGRQRTGSAGGGSAGGSTSESEQTLNQLLVEMDGMASKDGVVMLASTNRADVLDKALLRPGRFDRHILIDLPTMEERVEIFERHMRSIVLEHPPSYYSKRLAYLTPGFSGADIANVCNEAALHAARDKQQQVTGNDLEYAIERLVGGTEKRNHVMSHEEKRVVAFHESGHALVGWLLEHTDALLKVTIVPRTNLALGFAQYTPTDQKLYTKEQLFDRMCMALGGRVAEAITFNRITTGAQNDLDKVTKMAYAQIKQYGMSDVVGLLSFPSESQNSGKSPYSNALKELIDFEANKMITEAYYRTEKLLQDNAEKLKKIADELLLKETLNYEDVVKLIGPPTFADKRLVEPVEFELAIKSLAGGEQPQNKPSKGKSSENTFSSA